MAKQTLLRRSIMLLAAILLLTGCLGGDDAESDATIGLAQATAATSTRDTGTATATSSAPATIATVTHVVIAATPTMTPEPTTIATPVTQAELGGPELVEALRGGGYVIYFRHAATDNSQTDTDRQNLENCATQRNLSDEGRAEARMIGEAMQALEIPLGEVLASPYCRTRETAEIAFGRVESTSDLISPLSEMPESERQRINDALRDLLSTPPADGMNTILVSHQFNLTAVMPVSLAEGEAAIFTADSGSGFALVARLQPQQWPELARAAGVDPVLAPPAEPTMQEYDVPAGSRPHDVAPAPDGTVWYTAQGSGELGILDPATGETRHIPLGQGSAPHGVIVGPDEAAWITDGGQNAIVRFDPRSEEVQVYPLPPDRPNANLNTAAFDGNGVLWFTGQNGIYGRLDPRSGEMTIYDAPGGRGPYGIDATPDGTIYYASLAGSHIARIDTETGEATMLQPPTPGQGARRVWSDSGGRIWVSEWNAGQLGLYDPETESWREWRLPGDGPQAYSVYVDERDHVWLSDFGANAMVRFDPETEEFLVLPLPSENASVRQMLGRPGEVWGAESGVDKLLVIRTR